MRAHSAYLDGLRGLAALSIVVLHCWLYGDPEKSKTFADIAFHELRLGLICFFVLSGYLLYRSWLGSSKPKTKRYFSKRMARILPAYYLAMVGAIIIMAIFAPERLPEAGLLPLFLVFGQNFSESTLASVNPPTWTLVIEMSFYLVLPLIGLLAFRLAKKMSWQLIIPLALIAGGLTINLLFALNGGMPRLLVFSLPALIYYFAAGMLAAVTMHYRPQPKNPWLYLLIGFALIGFNIWLHLNGSLVVNATLRDLPAALGFAAIILSLPQKQEAGAVWRPLAWLGLISYGVYLWHMPILIALSNLPFWRESVVQALILTVPLSIICGALSWYLIERHFVGQATSRPKKVPLPVRPAYSAAREGSRHSYDERRLTVEPQQAR